MWTTDFPSVPTRNRLDWNRRRKEKRLVPPTLRPTEQCVKVLEGVTPREFSTEVRGLSPGTKVKRGSLGDVVSSSVAVQASRPFFTPTYPSDTPSYPSPATRNSSEKDPADLDYLPS